MSQIIERSAGDATPRSVIGQLLPTPRLFALMFAMLLGAISIGAREIARVRYATDSVGNELGVGLVAVLAALVIGVMSLFGGRLADAWDPRGLLIVALMLSALTSAITAWLLALGTIPVWWLAVSSILEGISLGVGIPSLLKVQAAIVRPNARGAAEIVNVVRSSLGAVIGTLLAGIIDAASTVLWTCAGLLVVTASGVAVTTRSSRPTTTRHIVPVRAVIAATRTTSALPATITVDLVLAVVLPSQFIALVIVDRDVSVLSSWAFTGALLGGLAGRLVLAGIGIGARIARQMQLTYLGFLMLCLIGIVTLIDDWLLERPLLVATMLFIGTALSTFCYSVTSALVQQQVPDTIRGSLSGALSGARSLLIAVSVALLTVVTLVTNAMVTVATMVVMLISGWVIVSGFRRLQPTAIGG